MRNCVLNTNAIYGSAQLIYRAYNRAFDDVEERFSGCRAVLARFLWQEDNKSLKRVCASESCECDDVMCEHHRYTAFCTLFEEHFALCGTQPRIKIKCILFPHSLTLVNTLPDIVLVAHKHTIIIPESRTKRPRQRANRIYKTICTKLDSHMWAIRAAR